MKRFLKIFAIILTVVIICLSFSGCNALEDLRERHISADADGVLTLHGVEYVQLPVCDELRPVLDLENPAYVTEKGVPLLLSPILGDELFISKDGKFLALGFDYEDFGAGIYYCKKDCYNEVIEIIENGFKADGYCYEYYDYENEDEKFYKLKENEIEAIHTVLKNVTPNTMPEAASMDYEYYLELQACSSDLLFRKPSYEIYLNSDTYYLTSISEENLLIYKVPENLNTAFQSICKEFMEAESYLEFF